ncbi:MAG: bifunctional (p)ppGpp synthetase/guanosine-3',5'-bis(diphosphate) 3'-pyrophosphohydrolase [bacterium]|nr:bifunctional (p)ppGpp synthetase/guanosine-3',5'-bis(diphosphate) 3'-pyrophosphohydrolase [bacterium]
MPKLPKPPQRPRKNVVFEDVLARLDAHERPYDREYLTSVYEFTRDMHQGQVRRSGEPYIIHPTYVAYLLADLKFDQTCVATGLLHDVLEDTKIDKQVLEEKFGAEVAELVDGVTKIGQQEYVRRDEAQAETFRKMILASAKDLRVILVKLADRLHNMMTLEHMSPDSRRRIAGETLEIYAPIALRLGMSKLQGDLEDLAFYFRYPRQFAELETGIRQKMKVARGLLQRLAGQLGDSLSAAGIEAEINYRVKRYYSIFRKLRRQEVDISQLYDYLAFRVITEDLKDTYAAFGVVHQNWRPIPGRFKDYIAMPKPNLYQSLHTVVIGEKGQPFEVQIRTREMDLVAEEGIAAHWQYKDQGAESGDPNILWLRQLLEWQKEVQDPREFLSALKIDLYPDEVYVFSPKGEVYSFPRGATPLDFAYRIHTELGHRCSGARVNGKLEPLKTPLKNGDMVEIMTGSGRKPSRDWLNLVVTSRARSKIRHWLNTERKRESEAIGRRLLERELKKLRQSPRKVLEGERMKEYLSREGLGQIEELYQRIGYGKIPLKRAVERLVADADLKSPEPGPLRRAVDRLLPGAGPVTVKGASDLMATLAKCCDPVPGDELVGFITRGRGISVHAATCPNVKNLNLDPERLIDVEWARKAESAYPVSLAIETEDHTGILARLTEVIAKESSNIRHFEADTTDTGRGVMSVVVEVRNRKHLDKLCRAIDAVKGVLVVSRSSGGGARKRRPPAKEGAR